MVISPSPKVEMKLILKLSRKLTRRALYRVPLAVWSRLVSKNEFVYCYHLASNETLPHVRHLYHYKTPQMFAEDLAWIGRICDLVDLDGFLQHRAHPSRGGRPVALITVDDGLTETFTVIRPILLHYNAPAIIFVITDCIDNRSMFYRNKASLCVERVVHADEDRRMVYLESVNSRFGQFCCDVDSFVEFVLSIRADQAAKIETMCEILGVDVEEYLAERKPYLTREQIEQLDREGFTIGAHSMNHFDFDRLSPAEIERQIIQSCTAVTEITGRTPVHFAFPFDMHGLDRGLLAQITRANPMVGTMFGAAEVIREPPYIDRILADSPRNAAPGKSNLPFRLREYYVNFVKFQLLGMSRG